MTADESMANQAASGPFVSPECDTNDLLGAIHEMCSDENCSCLCHRPDEESE